MWVYWMNWSLWNCNFLCFSDVHDKFPQRRRSVSTSALTWALHLPWWSMKVMIVGVSQCHTGEGENLSMTGEYWAVCWSGGRDRNPGGLLQWWWSPRLKLHPSRMACFQDQQATWMQCQAFCGFFFSLDELNYTSRCYCFGLFSNNFLAEHWMERIQEATQEIKERLATGTSEVGWGKLKRCLLHSSLSISSLLKKGIN